MRLFLGAVGLTLVLHGTPALACGHCVEDKVAATYDHRVLEDAQRKGNGIAYAEVTGAAAANSDTAAELQKLIARTPGVVSTSVRISAAPPAVSFAWDATHHDVDRVMAAINSQLAARGLRVSLLRQWDAKTGLR